jgi:eukaryotic-like serine/threonine-protein kinase
MPSERIQRRIDALLDEADAAIASGEWPRARDRALDVLALDGANDDARSFLSAAEKRLGQPESVQVQPAQPPLPIAPSPPRPLPASFASGRYTVHGFLGEGGSKKVYLAHDTRLDRDVAVAVVEGLDAGSLERVRREGRAVARLGDHPNIVAVYDTAEDDGKLLTVYQYMPGGSLADLVARGPVAFERIVTLGAQVCDALAFAHGKGVIHRDLKPANVFLAESGDAKLGDFGLAAALDRTRLTEQGTFLGTAAYMAPEQAMGQPADARSDLYSLGCVLYELTTGRPPFVGDDTVAVVTQHLNTPPVAPSWHRAEVPAGLEALVLRLLEKDPGKRPQSASESAQALRAIDLSPATVAASSSLLAPPSSPDPLYRTVFVGREQELRQLQNAFDAALSGNGGLVMVVGEPGIGKTALTGQLATYVAMRGGRALHGNCYEEGSLSLPYLPFVEAMRSYVLDHDAEALRSELGTNAPYVAKIVSEVREKVNVELPAGGDPEDERWRLLSGVTTFLKNAAAVQPLMLLLEDLHWSDRGTLDLLNHLGRNLDGARLLVVGTYRDVEVDRSHPLSAALAELRRSTNFSRVTLRGLGVDDVAKMLSAIAGREVPRQVADQVHRQTEGNPLFVQEMARWLVEEGHLRGGTSDSTLAMQIPEGLRDVIGRRISRLTPECNRILSIAAVIGRDFSFDVLSAVANLPDEALLAAIEDAMKVGVLQERAEAGTVHYRFAHAFFRQTLYEEMIAPRRLRLHQEVARALETQYARRLDEHAAELTEHFSYSTDPADLEKAVAYAERASQRAMAVFDYGEAARLLEKALGVQDVLDPDDAKRRSELQLGLAWAKQREGNQAAARELAFAVANIARREGSVGAHAGAAELVGSQTYNPMESDEPLAQLFRDLLEMLPPDDSGERAFAMVRLGLYLAASGTDYREAEELSRAGLEMARRLGEPRNLSRILQARMGAFFHLPVTGPLRDVQELQLALAEEIKRVSPLGVDGEVVPIRIRLGIALACGDMAEAGRQVAAFEDLGRRYRSTFLETTARGSRISYLTALGELDQALELAEQGASGVQLDPTGRIMMGLPMYSVRLLSALGRSKEAEEQLTELAGDQIVQQLVRALILARHRDRARAGLLFEEVRDRLLVPSNRVQLFAWHCSELCLFLDDKHAAQILYRLVLPYAGFNIGGFATVSPSSHGPADRCLGLLATTLGQFDPAEKHFLAAIEQCERQGTPTFLFESQYNYADMLLRRDGPGDRAKARRLLAQAIGGARKIGYVWLVQQALALQMQSQGLGGSDPSSSIVAVTDAVQAERPDLSRHAAPDGTVTLLFSDIVDSTPLNEAMGDAKWMDLLRAHNAVIEEQVRAHGGHVVKTMGDGYMVAFRSASAGLRCALATQRALTAAPALAGIRVRMGLHTGEMQRSGDDLFGRHVNMGARVASAATGGQVLVSSLLKELVAPSGEFTFDEGREVELKGLAGSHRVYAVVGG